MTTTSSVTSFNDSAGVAASQQSASKLSNDMDTFLHLLTTQLKYQDPLSPMDSTEFTNQLVQYSGVEQQIQTNEYLENLISAQNTNLGAAAINYIGKTVQISSKSLPLQEGSAKFGYYLPEEAKKCAVVIKDSAGKTVFTTNGEKTVGNNEYVWDGKDNNGNQLEDGAYYVDVTAIDLDSDKSLDVFTSVFGKVTGVANDENGVYLGIGDVVADLSDVLTIRPSEYIKGATTEETTDTTTEETTVENTTDTTGEETSGS